MEVVYRIWQTVTTHEHNDRVRETYLSTRDQHKPFEFRALEQSIKLAI